MKKKRFEKEKVKKKFKKVQKEVKEEFRFNVPNLITLSRLVLAFVFVYMLFTGANKWALVIVFAIAAASDWFDGYFARKLKQTSAIGARMDQVIDRVFTALIVIPLLVKFLLDKDINWIIQLLLISSREIIGIWGLVIRTIINKDAYKVKYIGKVTTFVQGVALGLIIIQWQYSIYSAFITCIVGSLAGLDYLKDSLM